MILPDVRVVEVDERLNILVKKINKYKTMGHSRPMM